MAALHPSIVIVIVIIIIIIVAMKRVEVIIDSRHDITDTLLTTPRHFSPPFTSNAALWVLFVWLLWDVRWYCYDSWYLYRYHIDRQYQF